MPSSPIPAARCHYLLDLLAQVPDPRKRRGRRHPLAGLLAVGVAAVIAGSRSFAAIGQWAADAGPEALAALGAARGPAEESTFRRAFALVSADALDRVLGAWLWTRAVLASGRLVIAIDGKTVRGAKSKDGKAPHLVAALAHGIGAVLGQVAVDEKSNEIPAVRELLKAFTDLAGAVFTIDAMHTQTDTAKAILARQADYVMTVKANMPTLYRQLKKLPWAQVPACLSREHGPRPPRPPHHQGRAGAGLDRVRRRRPGRAAAPHCHRERQEDRRGRLPHYQRRRRRSRHPRRLGPGSLGDRKLSSPSKRDTTTFCDLAAAMRVWAKGLLGLEAAVELLIGHGTWLTRADFAAAALTSGRDGITGAVMMSVDFEAALAARRAGGLPCSAGEEQILALAASIAAGVPAALGDLVCGLDEDNAVRVAIAVLHAAGFGGRSVLVTRGSRR